MKKYINKYGKECYKGVRLTDKFNDELFHKVEDSFEDDIQVALHTNHGSITVLDRMTGFGWRDIETGYRDPKGNFWLASGNLDIRKFDIKTIGEAIAWIKQHANTCKDA